MYKFIINLSEMVTYKSILIKNTLWIQKAWNINANLLRNKGSWPSTETDADEWCFLLPSHLLTDFKFCCYYKQMPKVHTSNWDVISIGPHSSLYFASCDEPWVSDKL